MIPREQVLTPTGGGVMTAPRVVSAGGSRGPELSLNLPRRPSIPVGTTTGQYPQDVDNPCFGVALEATRPVTYAQTPFIYVRQLDDIASRWIACKSIEGAYDAALDWMSRRLKSRPARAEKTQPPLVLKRLRA